MTYSIVESTNNNFTLPLRQFAYAISIVLIFLLPWRGLITLTEGVTVARLVGIIAGIAWIAYVLQVGRIRRLDTFHYLLLGLIAWMGLSMMWSVDTSATLLSLFTILSGGVFCIVIWDLFRTENDLATAAIAYIAGCFVLIFIEAYDFLVLGHFRIGDTVSGPNYVVARLIFGLPLAWYIVVQNTPFNLRIARYLSAVYLPVGSVAILFTRSRQGFITLAVALLLLLVAQLYINDRLHRSMITAIIGTVSVPIVAYNYLSESWADALPLDRLQQTIGVITGDVSAAEAGLVGRLEIYVGGLNAFMANSFVGTGAGTFTTGVAPFVETVSTPHNTYLAIGVELGIVGLLIFSLMIISLAKGLFRDKSPERLLGSTMLIVYLVISMANTWFTDFTALFLLTIVLLSSRPLLDG